MSINVTCKNSVQLAVKHTTFGLTALHSLVVGKDRELLFESSTPTSLNEFALVEPLARRVEFGFCSMCRSVVELLLNMREVPSSTPGKSFRLQFLYGKIKRGRQLEVSAK